MVARSVKYENAGTVEFLLQDNQFYFIEVNARIQVEHPVTECVTGVDLIQQQIRVAAGEPLPWKQRSLPCNGAAIEVRISLPPRAVYVTTGRPGRVGPRSLPMESSSSSPRRTRAP